MNREEKKVFVADLHDRLEKAEGSFLLDYKGLNVDAMSKLRGELREMNAEFHVVKNRLLKRACEETHTIALKDYMEGPTAIALTYEEAISPAKVLVNFSKEFKTFKIKSGQVSGRIMDAETIKRLAELPGREVLLAQALSAMQAVPASLVRVLNGVLVQFLNALKAIEQQKSESA